MRQVQISKKPRAAAPRLRQRGLQVLPPDLRDPDIVRAKTLGGSRRDADTSANRRRRGR
jgi:hypothetical protein